MDRVAESVRWLIVALVVLVWAVGAGGADRQYAPDRQVDVQHITIDVTPDFEARTIAGTTTIRFAPILEPLEDLRLDAMELDVSAVTSSATLADYSVTDEEITVTFDPPVPPGRETTVTIVYEAEPRLGLYFRTPAQGYKPEDTHLFTQGEAHQSPYWYPTYDYPNERLTSEVICRVPPEMTVLSNGRRISEQVDRASGLKAVRWLQDKPHVNYLIALVAGKLKKIDGQHRDIPLAFYTPASQIEYAENSFKETADMIAFFESDIGVAYPWDKYYQAAVQDFVAGGMENTSLTILTDRTLHTHASGRTRSSRGLVAHELVHQWFGDYVTCKDWSQLWLNEGFATYYQKLYDEYKDGRDALLCQMYDTARTVLRSRPVHEPMVHRTYENAGHQFDYRNYQKGAWVVHMLRSELGEATYRQCIKTYLQRHALGTVVTEDLRVVIEELTGRPFDRFFDQWVYHGGHPELKVSYTWSGKDNLAKVSVKQTQKTDANVLLFQFGTKVRFWMAGEPVDRRIDVDGAQHDFYFALPSEPDIVRFDPEYELLAKVDFDKPKAMLYAQLANEKDVIGRLLAIDALSEKEDKQTIERLKDVLNGDPAYQVREKASDALGEIHTDEAFDALATSLEQPDERVRLEVVRDIGGFYRPESLETAREVLKREKNPEIVAEALRSLGRYHSKQTRQTLVRYLNSQSYRNSLADAAIGAIRTLRDPWFAEPLEKVLRHRQRDLTARGFAGGLDALAQISRDEEDRTPVREFLTGYVNHANRRIQAGAIRALGTLGDPKAIAVLETFAGEDARDRVQRAARGALEVIRENEPLVPEEVGQLRESVAELQKENAKLKEQIEEIKKKLDAKEETTGGDEREQEVGSDEEAAST